MILTKQWGEEVHIEINQKITRSNCLKNNDLVAEVVTLRKNHWLYLNKN